MSSLAALALAGAGACARAGGGRALGPRLHVPQPLAAGCGVGLPEAQRHYLFSVMRLTTEHFLAMSRDATSTYPNPRETSPNRDRITQAEDTGPSLLNRPRRSASVTVDDKPQTCNRVLKAGVASSRRSVLAR